MSDIKIGDRVQVVVEGEVTYVTPNKFRIGDPLGHDGFAWVRNDDPTIEKVEPPVVTFGPGDTVRLTGTSGVVHLGKNGYINEGGAVFTRTPEWMRDHFTSVNYERVELHEAPL